MCYNYIVRISFIEEEYNIMALDLSKNPILFSIGTYFSYKINRRYYKNIHYVWCTTAFNNKKQPITSNPQTICKRYIEQVVSGDRHAIEIEANKAGILRGAQAKLNDGIITKEEHDEICQLVNYADYADFLPVLYVIDAKKVGVTRCIEVDEKDKASDASVEYKILDLSEGEYLLIDFKNLLSDYIEPVDKRAGK